MTQEGIDYSRGGPLSAAQLKAAGKAFVGRYAVNDKSPNGRGITATEYADLAKNNIGVFLYWESSEGWMRDGYAAGATAALNAQANIEAAGMPVTMPVYFSCDYDAPEEDQWRIDETLKGCASVLGANRVGLYAGYWPLLRAKQNGTAQWFCQTLAWSGGRLLDGVHLYQYDTNGNFINGVDVDLVRAYQENYGQASAFVNQPPIPNYPDPAPITWKAGEDTGWFDLNGQKVYAMRGSHVQAKKPAVCRTHASASAPKARANRKLGDEAIAIGSFAIPRTKPNGKVSQERWLVLDDLSRVRASSMTPMFPIKP